MANLVFYLNIKKRFCKDRIQNILNYEWNTSIFYINKIFNINYTIYYGKKKFRNANLRTNYSNFIVTSNFKRIKILKIIKKKIKIDGEKEEIQFKFEYLKKNIENQINIEKFEFYDKKEEKMSEVSYILNESNKELFAY